jgi:hypothetical protein
MHVINQKQQLPEKFSNSIYLVVTPLNESLSWKIISTLPKHGYKGIVFNPNIDYSSYSNDDDELVQWNDECIDISDCILLWIEQDYYSNRNSKLDMLIGEWLVSGKLIVGGYINNELYSKCLKYNVPTFKELPELIKFVNFSISSDLHKTQGERFIPNEIWKSSFFHKWYKSQKSKGNLIVNSSANNVMKAGPGNSFTFLWGLNLSVFTRSKGSIVDKIIVGSPDIFATIMYHIEKSSGEVKVALIKDYETNTEGPLAFSYRLPCGSSESPQTSSFIATDSINQSIDLAIDIDKLVFLESRLITGEVFTFSSNVFLYELSKKELNYLKSNNDRCSLMSLSEVILTPGISWLDLALITRGIVEVSKLNLETEG